MLKEKKYKPSADLNNKLRDEVVGKISQTVFMIQKGNRSAVHFELRREDLLPLADQLDNDVSAFRNAVGTGKENIYALYADAMHQAETVAVMANQNSFERLEYAVDNFSEIIETWTGVLSGQFASADQRKRSPKMSEKALRKKLEMLEEIRNLLMGHQSRVEKELEQIKKERKELEERIAKTDPDEDPIRLNTLTRQYEILDTRASEYVVFLGNYQSCHSACDLVHQLANEIIESYSDIGEKLDRAKRVLKVDALRKAIDDPKKAIVVLNKSKELLEKIKNNDDAMMDADLQLHVGETQATDKARRLFARFSKKHE